MSTEDRWRELTTTAGQLVPLEHALTQPYDWSVKGAPVGTAVPSGRIGATGTGLTDLPLPALTLRASTVLNNLHVMARFCENQGVLLAPHGKTHMAPQLLAAQLASGSWAITLASAQQLHALLPLQLPRVMIANEVLGSPELAILVAAARAGSEVLLWVDSLAGVAAAADAAAAGDVELQILLDIGYPGGRAGVRNSADAEAIARAVVAADQLRLVGVAGFEGLFASERVGGTGAAATTGETLHSYLSSIAGIGEQLREAGLLEDGYLLSAGGSSCFDAVVEVFRAQAPAATIVIRSGCYLTHDHHMNATTSPLSPGASPYTSVGALEPAFELWARVLSTPEPGLAILGFGRRDAPFDYGLPVPLRLNDKPFDATVFSLNDQHAYLRSDAAISPGDIVTLGISHPCTAFDKWRAIPVLDDDRAVIDLIRTYF